MNILAEIPLDVSNNLEQLKRTVVCVCVPFCVSHFLTLFPIYFVNLIGCFSLRQNPNFHSDCINCRMGFFPSYSVFVLNENLIYFESCEKKKTRIHTKWHIEIFAREKKRKELHHFTQVDGTKFTIFDTKTMRMKRTRYSRNIKINVR